MPGYLYEKLAPAPQIDPAHWRMLRLAIFRRLSCDQMSPNVFRVSSSRPNHEPYKVDAVSLLCPCDAADYCSHLAIAVDRWHEREADTETRGDYFAARRLDFGGLHLRDDLKADDKRFVKACVESAREKYAALFVTVERERVNF